MYDTFLEKTQNFDEQPKTVMNGSIKKWGKGWGKGGRRRNGILTNGSPTPSGVDLSGCEAADRAKGKRGRRSG